MTREGPCALCTKVRVPGKRIVSLARLDCLRGANEAELGFSPIAFAQASAPREKEETRPPLLRNRGDGETIRWPSAARRPGPMLALSFAFGGHEDANLAPIASLSHRCQLRQLS